MDAGSEAARVRETRPQATAAVALIILAGGAVYSLAEGRQFAESCYTALAIATTIGVSDDLEPKSALGRGFTGLLAVDVRGTTLVTKCRRQRRRARRPDALGRGGRLRVDEDPTLRHQRRLMCVLALLILRALSSVASWATRSRKHGAVVLGVRLLRIHGALVDWRRFHGSAHAGGRRLRGVLRFGGIRALDARRRGRLRPLLRLQSVFR